MMFYGKVVTLGTAFLSSGRTQFCHFAWIPQEGVLASFSQLKTGNLPC